MSARYRSSDWEEREGEADVWSSRTENRPAGPFGISARRSRPSEQSRGAARRNHPAEPLGNTRRTRFRREQPAGAVPRARCLWTSPRPRRCPWGFPGDPRPRKETTCQRLRPPVSSRLRWRECCPNRMQPGGGGTTNHTSRGATKRWPARLLARVARGRTPPSRPSPSKGKWLLGDLFALHDHQVILAELILAEREKDLNE